MSTKIEWTDETWNPVTGCNKVSHGCEHCYAERLALRLKTMRNPRYKNGFEVTLHDDLLDLPLTWKKPKMIFTCSMSDLFHEKVPAEFIEKAFITMNKASHHTFQVLTKRAERMQKLSEKFFWTNNIWNGVTVEDEDQIYRIDLLKNTPAKIKFLSVEPMLSDFPRLDLSGIDWVIVGGESGPGCREMKIEWVRKMRDQCNEQKIPFFFKQAYIDGKKVSTPELDGRKWAEFPEKDDFYV